MDIYIYVFTFIHLYIYKNIYRYIYIYIHIYIVDHLSVFDRNGPPRPSTPNAPLALRGSGFTVLTAWFRI